MKVRRKSRIKGFLIFGLVSLILLSVCLFSGIIFSIPSRTAEVFGPASPNLDPLKLYSQSLVLLLSEEQLITPVNFLAADQLFTVEEGDSLENILTGLKNSNLVRHPAAFRAYLIYSGIDTRIQPGGYLFSSSMSELELANSLGNPASAQITLSILSGWRKEEIAETLAGLGLDLSRDTFLEIVEDQKKEGYLFPGSYQIERNISAETLVDKFYQRFLSQITSDLEESINAQGLTIEQAVILASIIEREAVLEEEMPQIASVFLNRLGIDLNLAADPTVQYALGFNDLQQTWWTNPLSLDDLKINSPYNTYKYTGLPPGPICNPGLPALLAVAYPANTSYLYFRAACDGSGQHLFAETFDEHLGNACP